MSSFDFGAAVANAPANGFNNELAPAGEHIMRCTYAKWRNPSPKTGKYGVRMKWVIAKGEPGAGAGAWGNLWFHPSDQTSMGNLIRQLEAVGVSRDYLAQKTAGVSTPEAIVEVIAEMLFNKHARIKVKHRVWEGKPQAETDWINEVPKSWTPKTGGVPGAPSGVPSVPPPAPSAPIAGPPPPPPGMPV